MERNAYSPGPDSSPQRKDGRRAPRPTAALRKAWTVLLTLFLLAPAAELPAQTTYGKGLPTNAPAAGTYMGYIPNGARISAFHRGYIFLPQSDGGAGCTVWDISNIAAPVRVAQGNGGGNGHMWVKMGDLFWRQYAVGEIPAGSNADFFDFSRLPTLAAWTTPMSFPITGRSVNPQLFPLNYNEGNHTITDARNGQVLSTNNLSLASGVTGRDNKWRIGNLILFTPGDGQSGMAVFDAGDPKNIPQQACRYVFCRKRHPGRRGRRGWQRHHPLGQRAGRRPAVAASGPGRLVRHFAGGTQLGSGLGEWLQHPGVGRRHQLDEYLQHHHRQRRPRRPDGIERHGTLHPNVRHGQGCGLGLLVVGI
jgi:hypothetical protein